MSDVQAIRNVIQDVLVELNQNVTQLIRFKQDTQDLGQRLLDLRSDNQNVLVTAGTLLNTIPDHHIDAMVLAYRIMIHNLETYRAEL